MGVAQDTQDGLDQAADDRWETKSKTDLDILQVEISPDQWPGGFTRSKDKLIEQLDGEERDEDNGRGAKSSIGSVGHGVPPRDGQDFNCLNRSAPDA
jgi:hypothetical protein